jgi:hypothetical protein
MREYWPAWLICIFFAILGVGWELGKINDNLELIAGRIQEANMTYEEYCEYWPEKCEELF